MQRIEEEEFGEASALDRSRAGSLILGQLVSALDLIADEHGRANKTLQMLQLEARKQVVA